MSASSPRRRTGPGREVDEHRVGGAGRDALDREAAVPVRAVGEVRARLTSSLTCRPRGRAHAAS